MVPVGWHIVACVAGVVRVVVLVEVVSVGCVVLLSLLLLPCPAHLNTHKAHDCIIHPCQNKVQMLCVWQTVSECFASQRTSLFHTLWRHLPAVPHASCTTCPWLSQQQGCPHIVYCIVTVWYILCCVFYIAYPPPQCSKGLSLGIGHLERLWRFSHSFGYLGF